MRTYGGLFAPDKDASPAENANRYISGLHFDGTRGAKELFGGLTLGIARDTFLDKSPEAAAENPQSNRLDTGKVYRELISCNRMLTTGEEFTYEENELLRAAMLLEPTKAEMIELIQYAMKGKHGEYPSKEDGKRPEWAADVMRVFGV